MPPPWGSCGATDLKYFSFYSVSTCVTECETDYVYKQCGCIDISMPSGNGQLLQTTKENVYLSGPYKCNATRMQLQYKNVFSSIAVVLHLCGPLQYNAAIQVFYNLQKTCRLLAAVVKRTCIVVALLWSADCCNTTKFKLYCTCADRFNRDDKEEEEYLFCQLKITILPTQIRIQQVHRRATRRACRPTLTNADHPCK